jgi:DinB superfamily
MNLDLENTSALLSRTPATLDALLRGLPDTWVQRNEGGDTWPVIDVVGHLIYGDRSDWLTRAKIILQSGESRTFEPFDRLGQKREMEGKLLPQLLDEFARLRSQNIAELRAMNLSAEDLDVRGRHPVFGAVSLSELLAAWAVHDLTHLHQISRIMAYQYRELVGPWSRYLGVLHCAGHSASA